MGKTEYLISPHNQTIADNHLVGQPLSAWTPTLAHALETFERLELLVKERSPLTIRWYHERLESMCVFLGADRSPNEILDVDLLDWMATLRERGTLYGGSSSRPQTDGRLSPFTLRGYVRAARRFWRWLHKRGFIESNPAQELPMPSKCKIAKRGIADCDQRAMIEAARPSAPPSKERMSRRKQLTLVRDYAILMFLSATGCRLGGLAHLTLDDLRLDDPDERIRKRAYVIEKGNKGRYVFLNREAQDALREWLLARPGCPDSQVFIGCANGQTDWHALHEGGLYEIVRKYALRVGVKERSSLWSPHQWRHRFGRRWIENGGDLSRLSQLMGHSNSQITSEHYGQLEIDVLQDGYDEIMGS
jgi:site-specific recombinase XerD